MELKQKLIYALFAIFLIGVIVIIKTDNSSVFSRIATGLITGSFVAIINTVVSYYHERQEYFLKLAKNLFDVANELTLDYIAEKMEVDEIEKSTKEQIKDKYIGKGKITIKESTEFQTKYNKLANNVDLDSFAPLLPYPQMEKVIDDIGIIFKGNFSVLYMYYITGTMIVGNDEDEEYFPNMFDLAMQAKKDLRDQLAYELHEIGEIADRLYTLLEDNSSEMIIKTLEIVALFCKDVIKGVNLRNPIEERT